MRRPRQKLQVTTYPFLAVLLCAMGSLILLLLVIDRRAKVVARARLQKAQEQVVEEDARAEAERRAEWERKRQALLALLRHQHESLLEQKRGLENQFAAASSGLGAELDAQEVLRQHLRDERSRLAALERDGDARAARAANLEQQSAANRAELAKLTAELLELEQALAALKELRRRQQHTYSLVPYRGRQGDDRRPLYVECAAGAVVFHPDRVVVADNPLNPLVLRAEVERRVTRQRGAHPPPPNQPEAKPYLLMLIRPDGIATYYKTMTALDGIPLDFGYEFVEGDWLLDFPEAEGAPAAQPWMAAQLGKVPGVGEKGAGTGPVGPRVRGVNLSGLPRPVADPRARGASSFAGASGLLAPKTGPTLERGVQNSLAGAAGSGFGASPTRQQGVKTDALAGAAGSGEGAEETAAPTRDATEVGPPRLLPEHTPSARSRPEGAGSSGPRQPGGGNGEHGAESAGQGGQPGPAARPRPLGGSRDWVITVECAAEGVVVQPGSIRLTAGALRDGEKGTKALQDAVRGLIARRQAMVRPGELPYRPQIRFRVQPDGWRVYYLAYPALEPLGVPMKRENLERDQGGSGGERR